MPQIDAAEYRALPLRAHAFLDDVPLHDVWALDLPPADPPVTLAEFDPLHGEQRSAQLSPVARALFRLRFFLGRMFALDAVPKQAAKTSFAERLTPDDRARSTMEAGTPYGSFRVVYWFENESLLELHNATVHAALASSLWPTPSGYRFVFAVYVANQSPLTPLYMALIDPFRRWFVYPSLLRTARANWLEFVSRRRPPSER